MPGWPRPTGYQATSRAALEIEEKALRDVDQDAVVEDFRDDVPVVDVKHAPGGEPRFRAQSIAGCECGGVNPVASADSDEGVAAPYGVLELIADHSRLGSECRGRRAGGAGREAKRRKQSPTSSHRPSRTPR